jgi:hypothetical protein
MVVRKSILSAGFMICGLAVLPLGIVFTSKRAWQASITVAYGILLVAAEIANSPAEYG